MQIAMSCLKVEALLMSQCLMYKGWLHNEIRERLGHKKMSIIEKASYE
jgi:hypothetical protein